MKPPQIIPLEIKRGIPIPRVLKGDRGVTATFRKMRIGESIDVPRDSIARVNLYTLARRVEIKITTRSLFEEKTKQPIYRVWRVE
jgi:hypothetical protein